MKKEIPFYAKISRRSRTRYRSHLHCGLLAGAEPRPAHGTRPQGRDDCAGALRAQHSARHAEPAARNPRWPRRDMALWPRPTPPAGAQARPRRPTCIGRRGWSSRWTANRLPARRRCRPWPTSANTSTAPLLARTSPFAHPDGTKLLELTGWSQAVPNQKGRHGRAGHTIAAPPTRSPTLWARPLPRPDDEHYYGLGQNQEGFLDHRGHPVHCWARLHGAGRAQFLRAVSGHQQGLWAVVGQPFQDHHRAGLQRADPLDLRSGQPRLLLRDRRRHRRRDLLRATGC